MDLLSIYELLKRLIIEKQYISSTLKKSIKDESSDELLEVCISHNHDVSNLCWQTAKRQRDGTWCVNGRLR